MTAFADLGLSKDALKAVERLEYTTPTPVQEQAIPIVLEGRDLIAAASTGTGKTAAFLLPILSTLPRAGRGKRAPRVLVVTPTRELAQQISFTCIKIARATGHFATTVYGGTSYGPQIRELRGGTDILIATPGRLKDLMTRGVVDLSCIETLVLDEADRMLDMGFLPDVTTIVEATPQDRQTLLFSATIDKSIENNLGSLLRDPAVVQIAHKGETAATVEQFIMPVTQREKAELLKAVLEEKGSERVIVFARTKSRTEDVADMLRDAGFSAESIHSDKTQAQRRRALENFRRGKADILVATDVLARGIDVTGVDHVINYDLPDMPEDYVHRIGRTGRAGEEGYAISFVSPDTKRLLREVEKLINREIPLMELESYDLDLSLLKKSGKRGSSRGETGRKRDTRGERGGKENMRARAEKPAKSERKAQERGRAHNNGSQTPGKARDYAGQSASGEKHSQRKGAREDFRPNNRRARRAAQFADRQHDSYKPYAERDNDSRSARGNSQRPAGKYGAHHSGKQHSADEHAAHRGGKQHAEGEYAARREGFRKQNHQERRSFGRTDNRAYVQNRPGYSTEQRDSERRGGTFRKEASGRARKNNDREAFDATPAGGKRAYGKQKRRPADVSDTRSFGEKRGNRKKSKRK